MTLSGQLAVAGVKQLFKLQVAVMFVLVVIAMIFGGMFAAESALAGALVFLIPNFIFARHIFKHKGASSAKQIVKDFYKGESFKIVLSIFLFAAVFSIFRVQPLVFFVVYITMQFMLWLAPIVVNHKAKPRL